jgi:hypothetical protein
MNGLAPRAVGWFDCVKFIREKRSHARIEMCGIIPLPSGSAPDKTTPSQMRMGDVQMLVISLSIHVHLCFQNDNCPLAPTFGIRFSFQTLATGRLESPNDCAAIGVNYSGRAGRLPRIVWQIQIFLSQSCTID